MHYYQFNIGDYMGHTAHLDEIEDLAYRRMIDYCYLNEIGLPKSPEEIARLIRMRTHCESIARVLKEFFYQDESGDWRNHRVEKEIAAYKEKSDKATKAARKRWDNADANALQTQTERNAKHKPLTNNHKPLTKKQETDNNASQLLGWFDDFWASFDSAYGDKGSKKNALAQFKKINPDQQLFDEIMSGLSAQLSEKRMKQSAGVFYAPFQHVERWLKNRRWEDEVSNRIVNRDRPTKQQRIDQALDEAFGTGDEGSIEGDFETVIGDGLAQLGGRDDS